MSFNINLAYLSITCVFLVTSVLSTSLDTSLSSSSSDVTSTSSSVKTSDMTPNKPEQNRIALASIKTFDFSSRGSAPSKKEEKECTRPTTDICDTMKGICNNGTCTFTNCSEITCICNGSDYGRFCEKKIVKEHVNGVIVTTPANENTVTGSGNGNTNMQGETTTVDTSTSNMKTPTENTTKTVENTSVNGYKKGPEALVGNDTSVLNVNSTKSEIIMETPTVIDKTSATVTLSTVSWKNTKVGLPKESLETLVTSRKDSTNPAATSKAESQPKSESPKQNKNTVVLSKSNIEQGSKTVLTEETGTVKNSAKTISSDTTVSLSDVKVGVEKQSNGNSQKKLLDKVSGIETPSSKNKDLTTTNDKQVTNENKPSVAETMTVKQTDKSSNNVVRDEVIKIRKDITITKESIINPGTPAKADSTLDATGKVLVNADVLTSASQHSEMRKSMQSSVLNPLFQFLSMIGSGNFTDNVSSVKIEIITKQNGTAVGNNNDVTQHSATSSTTSSSKNIKTDNVTPGTNSPADSNVPGAP